MLLDITGGVLFWIESPEILSVTMTAMMMTMAMTMMTTTMTMMMMTMMGGHEYHPD